MAKDRHVVKRGADEDEIMVCEFGVCKGIEEGFFADAQSFLQVLILFALDNIDLVFVDEKHVAVKHIA